MKNFTKIEHWESGREEIRKIPLVCPNDECVKKVQVSAFIQDGQLVIENCPACGMPIDAALYIGAEEAEQEIQYAVSAEVRWHVDGSVIEERSTKFGPVVDILSIILYVLHDGVDFFGSPYLSSQQIYAGIADFIIRNRLQPEQLKKLMGLCSERLMSDAVMEQFTVIKASGNNGGAEPSGKKEDEEDNNDDE
jgi:hypothetical protein